MGRIIRSHPKREFAECRECGRRLAKSELYWTDIYGQPKADPRCVLCHERRVWRICAAELDTRIVQWDSAIPKEDL